MGHEDKDLVIVRVVKHLPMELGVETEYGQQGIVRVCETSNEILRIDEIISETIHFMRDISHELHMKISFRSPENLLVIKNQAAALERSF